MKFIEENFNKEEWDNFYRTFTPKYIIRKDKDYKINDVLYSWWIGKSKTLLNVKMYKIEQIDSCANGLKKGYKIYFLSQLTLKEV